jgi:hypothetical protein
MAEEILEIDGNDIRLVNFNFTGDLDTGLLIDNTPAATVVQESGPTGGTLTLDNISVTSPDVQCLVTSDGVKGEYVVLCTVTDDGATQQTFIGRGKVVVC